MRDSHQACAPGHSRLAASAAAPQMKPSTRAGRPSCRAAHIRPHQRRDFKTPDASQRIARRPQVPGVFFQRAAHHCGLVRDAALVKAGPGTCERLRLHRQQRTAQRGRGGGVADTHVTAM